MTTRVRNRGPASATSRARQNVCANGVSLCVESFGDRSEPAILLIMGAGASMESWEDPFCERLAAGGRSVVRYDHRDMGQ